MSFFNATYDDVRSFGDGQIIFEEGTQSREIYIVQEGAVLIKKKTNMGDLLLAEFQRGDFFGDMALLQNIPRFAAAIAKGPTKLLVLKPSGFLLKIQRDPTFAFEMLQQLSMRLKVTNERLLGLIESGVLPVDKAQEVLTAIVGE
jgi:CRP/FNR family transcriptional regulator, cyclic AMP receptor protein